jgi:hypothetical protein
MQGNASIHAVQHLLSSPRVVLPRLHGHHTRQFSTLLNIDGLDEGLDRLSAATQTEIIYIGVFCDHIAWDIMPAFYLRRLIQSLTQLSSKSGEIVCSIKYSKLHVTFQSPTGACPCNFRRLSTHMQCYHRPPVCDLPPAKLHKQTC